MAYQTRSADWVMQKAWLEAKLKGTAPLSGTTKYTVLLSLIDTELKNWEMEEGVEWDSLYSVVSGGAITATDTFTLPTSVRYISKREGDSIYIKDPTTSNKAEITLVRPNQLFENRTYDLVAAQIGRNLVFSKPFDATSQYIGNTLYIPAITYANDITTGSDIVNCDSPLYIAYMTAASYARNDLIKMGQYQNILDKATVLMNRMKQNNSGQLEQLDLAWTPNGESWN